MMDTAVAARAVGGAVVGASVRFRRVTTDTRALHPDDLFVALSGERFDGHDFVAAALAGGAAAALIARPHATGACGNLVVVDDTLVALGALAGFWRTRFDIPLVVVTGSNGKTTTKEMIGAIFRAAEGDSGVAATPGNFNNSIGLPLALLGLRASHRLGVFEIGMNHRGETRELARIAQPTIAVITNAQREHQEFMRTVDEVAAEHADAIASLRHGGRAVINADDPRAGIWCAAAAAAGASVLTFGLDGTADVHGRLDEGPSGGTLDVETPRGRVTALLRVPGRHMASNALAAAAAAEAAGVPI
ncbi:MAG: Mur ligase family protein, partial [Betaproteobacteria bacterium]